MGCLMYAVEFQTMITDGKIEIPIEYKAKLINSVRVIVLMEEKKHNPGGFIKQLLSHPLNLEGFTPLTREEIYTN